MERSGLAVLYCAALKQRHIFAGNFSYLYDNQIQSGCKEISETTKLPQRCYSCSPSLSLLLGYVARADSKIARSIYLV